MKQYEVYHSNIRDAQVYKGDPLSDSVDIYDEAHEYDWVDFSKDPLIDVVDAEDEYDATAKVAQQTGYHVGNLYAVEHIVSATGYIEEFRKEYPFRMEAGRFDDGDLTGISVTLPDGRTVKVALDRVSKQFSILVEDTDNPDSDITAIDLTGESHCILTDVYTVTASDGSCGVYRTRESANDAMKRTYNDTLRILNSSADMHDHPIAFECNEPYALIITKNRKTYFWNLSKKQVRG